MNDCDQIGALLAHLRQSPAGVRTETESLLRSSSATLGNQVVVPQGRFRLRLE